MIRPILTAFGVLAAMSSAVAQNTSKPDIATCSQAVGTYLTSRINEGVSGPEHVGRSLLSLTRDGQAALTDSAQGGVEGYQPFSNGRGSWRCRPSEGDAVAFEALILDFTFPTQAEPDPKIARVTFLATVDANSGKLTGNATIAFTDLAGDPLDSQALPIIATYDFSGVRVAFSD